MVPKVFEPLKFDCIYNGNEWPISVYFILVQFYLVTSTIFFIFFFRMPSKGRYTAGKQVSRWEADSENIDIEYKNLESQGHANICSSCSCAGGERKNLVIKLLTITVVFGVGLVLGYLVRKNVLKRTNFPVIVSAPDGTNKSDIYRIRQVPFYFTCTAVDANAQMAYTWFNPFRPAVHFFRAV